MARGPSYRVPFRRRREGKTNYYLRRGLLLSGKHRAVIRPTVKNITCQVADAHLKGDIVVSAAHSKELEKKYGWPYGKGNLPAAYLTGYLLGKKALKAGVGEAIADIGLRVHLSRTFAALKGIVDAGLDVPHSDEIFPGEDRLNGKHIAEYAAAIAEGGDGDDEGPSGNEQQFKKYSRKSVDVGKMPSTVEAIKKKIDKEHA